MSYFFPYVFSTNRSPNLIPFPLFSTHPPYAFVRRSCGTTVVSTQTLLPSLFSPAHPCPPSNAFVTQVNYWSVASLLFYSHQMRILLLFQTYPFLSNNTAFSESNQCTLYIRNFYTSSSFIYCIRCNFCNKPYVGQVSHHSEPARHSTSDIIDSVLPQTMEPTTLYSAWNSVTFSLHLLELISD